MGKLFRNIADEALKALDPDEYKRCDVCGAEGPVYKVHGEADGEDVYAVCADCILAGKVESNDEWKTDELLEEYLEEVVEGSKERKAAMKRLRDSMRRTPLIPLMVQGADWPLCCLGWMEFVGSPSNKKELLELQDSAEYWEGGPQPGGCDFRETGPPESFREVSAFRCRSCGKRAFVFQHM